MSYKFNNHSLELRLLTRRAIEGIKDSIRGYSDNPIDVVFIAYLFYKLLNTDNQGSGHQPGRTAESQWNRFISGEIAISPYVLNSLNRTRREQFINTYSMFERENLPETVYAAIVMTYSNYSDFEIWKSEGDKTTPDSLVALALAILGIKAREKVADICCGYGNFITTSIEIEPRAEYFGYEINITCAAVLAMRADVLESKVEVEMGDVEYTLPRNDVKFDKIFSNFPIGQRMDKYGFIAESSPFWIGKNSGDWYFNNIVMNNLAENGRAVTIASVGSTWNLASREARKYFVDNGYIEAVINLPGGLIPHTSIPLIMYVFSHGNKSIKFIDAEDMVDESARRYGGASLNERNIAQIMRWLLNEEESDKSILVPNEEAAEKDYSLAFRTYRNRLPKYDNATSLSEVSTIIRGTVLAKRSSIIKSENKRYLLQLSDLENGLIKKELGDERIIIPDKDLPGQILRPYDIIVSRSAKPIKVAIVSPEEKREMYPNGSMFIIRLKSAEVNPYYLLAFLLSKEGQEALDYIATGSSLKILSRSLLAELVFPMKGEKEQKRIADKIAELLTQYEVYSLKANLAKDEIENVFYSEKE